MIKSLEHEWNEALMEVYSNLIIDKERKSLERMGKGNEYVEMMEAIGRLMERGEENKIIKMLMEYMMN